MPELNAFEKAGMSPEDAKGKALQLLLKTGAKLLEDDAATLTVSRRGQLTAQASRCVTNCMILDKDKDGPAMATCLAESMTASTLTSAHDMKKHSLASVKAIIDGGAPGSRFAAALILQELEMLGRKDKAAKAAGLELVRLLDDSMAKGLPHAGCQRGMLHLRDGNRSLAVTCYRHSASLGNPVSMYKLANLLVEGTEEDVGECAGQEVGASGESRKWIWRAADTGHAEALNVKAGVLADEHTQAFEAAAESEEDPGEEEAAALDASEAEVLDTYVSAVKRGSVHARPTLARMAKRKEGKEEEGEDEEEEEGGAAAGAGAGAAAAQKQETDLLWEVLAYGPSDNSAYGLACLQLAAPYMQPSSTSFNLSKAMSLLARGAATGDAGCRDFGARTMLQQARCGYCAGFEPLGARLLDGVKAFSFCARCKSEQYCGAECQKSHWKKGKADGVKGDEADVKHKDACNPSWPVELIKLGLSRYERSLQELERSSVKGRAGDPMLGDAVRALAGLPKAQAIVEHE